MKSTDKDSTGQAPVSDCYGYRNLSKGDIVASGDEAFDPFIGEWVPTIIIGLPVICGEYRRPILPGYGYRLLSVGEKIAEGDEFFSLSKNVWKVTSCGGDESSAGDCPRDTYRRKVEAAPVWRIRAIGELIRNGDVAVSKITALPAGSFSPKCFGTLVSWNPDPHNAPVVKPDGHWYYTTDPLPPVRKDCTGDATQYAPSAAEPDIAVKVEACIDELTACNVEAQHQIEHLTQLLGWRERDIAHLRNSVAEKDSSQQRSLDAARGSCDLLKGQLVETIAALDKRTAELARAQTGFSAANEIIDALLNEKCTLQDDLHAAKNEVKSWRELFVKAIDRNEKLTKDNSELRERLSWP
jgi:hypothetical protein